LSGRKRLGIIQSNYIPWKGYFDFIASVDEFVLLDEVQYTRRDWRNRNKIKTNDGLRWLTIPVDTKGKYDESIDSILVAGHEWTASHAAALRHAYGRAPHFRAEWPRIEGLYEMARGIERLSEINVLFLQSLCERLGISTLIRSSRDYATTGGKNERLISICKAAGATAYLSGAAAKDYLDSTLWSQEGISVEFKSYDVYPEYPQLYGDFVHGVTVLDVLFNTGSEARSFVVTQRG
jgi:hypothetical protein